MIGKARLMVQFLHRSSPFFLHHHAQQVATLGDLDGRLHQIGKGQFAKTLTHRHPTGHRAWHRHRIDATLGWLHRVRAVFVLEIFGRPRLRRSPRSVQTMQGFAIPQNTKRIRPQTAADRLDDGEHSSRCDGSVHRIAALPQDAQARLGGQRVRGRNNIAGKNR